jgi:hypothetical protein
MAALVMDLVDTVYPPNKTLEDTIRSFCAKRIIEEDLKGSTQRAASYMPKGSRCTLLMPQMGGWRLAPAQRPPNARAAAQPRSAPLLPAGGLHLRRAP